MKCVNFGSARAHEPKVQYAKVSREGWVRWVLLKTTQRPRRMVDGNNNTKKRKKIKGKKSRLTFTLSAAARSSDIWVARMKSTGVVRLHADSAAGYCLSNALCYSENIVIHLHAFSPQACNARTLWRRASEREPSDLYGGSEQPKISPARQQTWLS